MLFHTRFELVINVTITMLYFELDVAGTNQNQKDGHYGQKERPEELHYLLVEPGRLRRGAAFRMTKL
jgi:hypothetical protein